MKMQVNLKMQQHSSNKVKRRNTKTMTGSKTKSTTVPIRQWNTWSSWGPCATKRILRMWTVWAWKSVSHSTLII